MAIASGVENEQMENVWDEHYTFGKHYEETEESTKDNSGFYKGLAIGGGVGAGLGLAGLGLWIKERRDNKELFKVLDKVNKMALEMHEKGEEATVLKYNKEEIDLTKKTMKNPIHLQVALKEEIDKMKLVSNKKKQKWYEDLKELSRLSAEYKNKEILEKAEAKMKATEEMHEN
jgi:hypothetical protein